MAKATAVEGSAQADIAALTPEQIRDILEQNATLKAAEAQREQDALEGVSFDVTDSGYLNFKCKGSGSRSVGMTVTGWQTVLDRADRIRDILESKGEAMKAAHAVYLANRKK